MRERFTPFEKLAVFPNASCDWTLTRAEQPPAGIACAVEVKRSFAGGAEAIANALLAARGSPLVAARKLYDPLVVRLRPENVAIPWTALTVVLPKSVTPLTPERETVTGTDELLTTSPLASLTAIWKEGI